ncbi:MAG: hypothetical protein WA667_24075 [Candidatus Nitrosopolaris sp.]
MSSAIKSERIEQFELGPFWEDHREMLSKLVKTEMPSKSRMHYTEVVADRHPETNNLLIKYGLINFASNKKNFLRIHAEMAPDYTVKHEEIIFGDNLHQAKKTALNDNQIHNGHREWLKNHFDKHCKPYE